jgi:D-beta-D-heptose 7-phosphate kinase/D-beta-D-heptose 1-phosphate adenosyltransferase
MPRAWRSWRRMSRSGTSVCTNEELAAQATSTESAVLSGAALEAAIARDREHGRRIVFTNGCFDVLHLGHTSYLRQAREVGDRLIVAVNSDDSVRRLKGGGRPVNAESDRAAVVAALECVDYVTIFEGDTPIPLLEALHPDVYVKGGDYSPEMLAETAVVRAYGGEVLMVGYVPAHSTTAMVDRIRSTTGAQVVSTDMAAE